MKNKTTMGKLLADFRFRRQAAADKSEKEIWKKNKLDNPTKRGGYEIRESRVHDREGNTLITTQLWKKIDEKRVRVSVEVKTEEIVPEAESAEEVKDLLK